jgi:hypothetical protein
VLEGVACVSLPELGVKQARLCNDRPLRPMKLHQIAVGAVGASMTDRAVTPCGPSALSFARSDDITRFISELAWLQVTGSAAQLSWCDTEIVQPDRYPTEIGLAIAVVLYIAR